MGLSNSAFLANTSTDAIIRLLMARVNKSADRAEDNIRMAALIFLTDWYQKLLRSSYMVLFLHICNSSFAVMIPEIQSLCLAPELNDIKKGCIIHESGGLFNITVISVGTIRYLQLSAHLNFAGSREFLFTKSLDSNMS